MKRNVLVAISLANLWYLRVWSELLTYSRSDQYLMVHPPRPAEYFAVIANVLLAAAAFLACAWFANRVLPKRAVPLAVMAFVASLLVPLNALREVLGRQFPDYFKSPLINLIGVRGVVLLAATATVVGAFIVLRWSRPVARGAVAVLLFLSPFSAVTFGQALWRAARYDESEFRALPPAPPVVGAKQSHRLVWFICDEWDYRLTFPDRTPGLALPEIDRLRSESLSADNAYPPGTGTPESIPSYYTGRLMTPVWYRDTRHLAARYKGEPGEVRWGDQPNIFEQVRTLGYDTALLEWFHPTCRVLNGLTSCAWWPLARQFNSTGDTFFEIVPRQARSLLETNLFSPFGRTITAEYHIAVYRAMLDAARQLLAEPKYGFTVIHLPVPHNPFVYDRRTGDFTLGNAPIRGYIDHLALLDRTIGDLRRTMEQSGQWDSTTVLFTSDHEYREAAALDGKYDVRIPYLLRFAGQKQPIRYEQRFNAVLTADLLLAILRGEVATAADATGWLDRNNSRFPMASDH